MTDPTPEMVAMAQRIAKRIANEPDEAYSNEVYLAALAAIIETSEMAAKLADEQAEHWRQAGFYNRHYAVANAATAIRAYDHIKPENG